MTVYTIKGLSLNRDGVNPTYYGNLKDAIKYVNNHSHEFIQYQSNIIICEGETPKAIQKWIKKIDEVGEYYEPLEWEVVK